MRADSFVGAPWRAAMLCVSAIIILCGVPRAVWAQRASDVVALATHIERDDGTVVPLARNRNGFALFGETDRAGASLRLTGAYRYATFNVGGLCPYANISGDEHNTSCGAYGSTSTFFQFNVAWGTGPSAYQRIRAVWPSVELMLPPVGYSTPWRITAIAPQVRRIGPADGEWGRAFSGATALNNAGCRDVSGTRGAGFPVGVPLTALSDCPETWGSDGFVGARVIPDSVWRARFVEDPAAFRWDDWAIPAARVAAAPPVGDFSTFGTFSDFGRETLARYGHVTPRGATGQPAQERGFPLGIEVRYDAFKFDRPTLRDGVFVRWLVINHSAKVWGSPIDYDSLYMGVDPSYITSSPTIYNVPALGVHVLTSGGLSGRCSSQYPRRRLPGVNEACAGATAHTHITMVLKSPIGDLRNKLFSDPASPYYAPTHAKADDTITFNHWRKGGFGAQEAFSWRRSDRALYGLFSAREDLWLDGRAATGFSAAQIWNFFRYEFTDGTQSAANLRYNRSAPGAVPGYGRWDYNDDGVQDTLYLPDCGVQGCSALWSDTIAGGYSARTAGNIGNYLGVGPFALRAGDTTAFMWYVGAAADTLSVRHRIRNVTEAYLANFNTVGGAPPPRLAAGDVNLIPPNARDTVPRTQVRIQLKMPAIVDDAYLARVLARLESSEPAAVDVRRLNPGIVDSVRGRVRQNRARLLVFKSCDSGRSWTDATGTCESAMTARTERADGSTAGIGWQYFRAIGVVAASGALNTYVVTDAVMPGREYLYSFVTQTRGLADFTVVYQQTQDANGVVTSRKLGTLGDALGVDVDTITSALSAVGPATVRVYAPVSIPAGTLVARIDTATRQGRATQPVSVVARSPNIEGTYRMRFGNRFVLTRAVDTVLGTTAVTLIRQSLYTRATLGPGAPALGNFVAAADTFVGAAVPVTSQGLTTTPRSTIGSVKRFVDTITQVGYVFAKSGAATDPLMLMYGTDLVGATQPTAAFEGSVLHPGFTAAFRTVSVSPTAVRFAVSDARGDSVPRRVVDSAGVRYVATTTTNNPSGLRSSPGGVYRLEWLGDSFGPGAPFAFGTREHMQPVVNASLGARAFDRLTDTTNASRLLILGGQNNVLATRPLVAATVPFRLIGLNGEPATLVMVKRNVPGAADSAVRNSRVFGVRGDTTRVAIPPNAWMPGDTLYVIERIETDSTIIVNNAVTPVVRDTVVNGRVQTLPIRVHRRVYAMWFVLACPPSPAPSRVTCNPIRPGLVGHSAYLPYAAGYTSVFGFARLFDQNSEVALTASPVAVGAVPLTRRDLAAVRVVPNPYIVQSTFDRMQANGSTTPRVLFVNVPPEGLLRIYTISGQLVQQLSWTRADLVTIGDGSPHGDLPYNLKTREGLDLTSGLYVYVMTARGERANGMVGRGKFVVVR